MATFDVSEEYDFVEQPPGECFCPVSFAVLLEPYQTRCCGNHLSQEAYQRLQGQPCPVCREENLTAVDDKFHKRKVLSLKVRCPHKAEGCEWEGELGSLEQHLNTTSIREGCQYVAVKCPNFDFFISCHERVQRRDLEEHMSQHCPVRAFTCQYCNYEATYQEVTKEHWPVCEKYPLPCPNECGEEKIRRKHLKGHLEQTCPLEVIQCEYSYAGCGAQLQRRLMPTHMKENMEAHLLLMTQEVSKLHKRDCQLEACIKQQADQNKQQGDQIKQQGDQMKHDRDQIKQQANQIKQQEDQIKQQEDQIKQQEDKLEQGDGLIEKLLLAKQIEQQGPGDQIETLMCIPPVDIVMDKFRERKRKANAWYSPPFYSHLGGYKMCLRVFANGYGIREGTHVSVHVCLMRGEFDDILKWPFCGDITVELRQEQPAFQAHAQVIGMDLFHFASNKARRRPFAERNGSGFGIHHFISHEDIHTEGYNCCNTLKFCVSEVAIL